MKKLIRTPTASIDGKIWPILVDPRKQQACYQEILLAIHEQLEAMLSHHSRLLVLRMEFHVYTYTADNALFSRFIRKLKKRLMNKYDFLRIGHVWAREQHNAVVQHYHAALMLDGNKVQNPAAIIALCEEIWTGWNQPKPATPRHCFYKLGRNNEQAFAEVFKRLSYLAKIRGKGDKSRPRYTNDYSTSRIKPRANGNSHVPEAA